MILSGPTHDFNVIWRRDRARVSVLHRPLAGAMDFLAEPAVTWLVLALRGQARLEGAPLPIELGEGDSALIEPGEPGSRAVLEGGGEVLLVRIDRGHRAAGDPG